MDVRVTIKTGAGDYIHCTSTGRTVVDDAARELFLAGETLTSDHAIYGRNSPLFATASEPYAWLNGTVATGKVIELSLKHIRYQIFAVR